MNEKMNEGMGNSAGLTMKKNVYDHFVEISDKINLIQKFNNLLQMQYNNGTPTLNREDANVIKKCISVTIQELNILIN